MDGYVPIGTGYVPIGTGYKPIGTGYNRAKSEYGFTGVLEDIKNNNLFAGEFNNKTADEVKKGVATGTAPRTGWPTAIPTRTQPLMGGNAGAMSNPAQYLGANQPSYAAQMLGQPLDAHDSVLDTNNNGIVDPWEMI